MTGKWFDKRNIGRQNWKIIVLNLLSPAIRLTVSRNRIKRDPRQTFPGEKVRDVRNNSDAGRDKLVQIDAK